MVLSHGVRTLGELRSTVKTKTYGLRSPIDLSYAIGGLKLGERAAISQNKKTNASKSLRTFCLTYLKKHFPEPFCEMHDDLFQAVDDYIPGGGKRVARIAPRKFGKTTIISLGLPLYMLAYYRKQFILMIGESSQVAEGNLATLVQEVESNERLLRDFPHLAPAKDPKGQLVKWTDEQVVFVSGQTVMAKGMGSRMRGIKYRHKRPDLAIIDDPESPETADTFLKRMRHRRWFGGTFLGLGDDRWDIYVIANLPHHDSLISHLVRSEEWNGKLWRAINIPLREEERYPLGNSAHDGSALWPEKWPLEALEKYRRDPTVGALGFAREMMSDPRSEEEVIFNVNNFTFFDTPEKYSMLAIAVDPAGGDKGADFRRGLRDYAAIIAGGRRATGVDVFGIKMTKKTPEKQIEYIIEMCIAHNIRTVGVEENMYMNLYDLSLDQEARKKGLFLTILPMKHHTNKVARINGLVPLVTPFHGGEATLRFHRPLLKSQVEYFAQYEEFPGMHDDGPDATELLVRILEAYGGAGVPVLVDSRPSFWKGFN